MSFSMNRQHEKSNFYSVKFTHNSITGILQIMRL